MSPMTMTQTHHDLSRRERQIVDILYAQGHATAAEVQAALPEMSHLAAPKVAAIMLTLEDLGYAGFFRSD